MVLRFMCHERFYFMHLGGLYGFKVWQHFGCTNVSFVRGSSQDMLNRCHNCTVALSHCLQLSS
jgi:hypothetical protein